VFESVTPDPGADGLTRAARIFYVIAALSGIAVVLYLVAAVAGGVFQPFRLIVYGGLGALAYVTGKGIENQRRWAKWMGITLGILELFNLPIGTVIGIAILIYLRRAIKVSSSPAA